MAVNKNHANSNKTHCKRGHPLSGDNLMAKVRDGKVKRECRKCRNALRSKRMREAREAGAPIKSYRRLESKKRNDKLYRQKHKDHLNNYKKNWRKRFPEKAKAAKLRQIYGITLAEYKILLETHNNRCAICDSPHADWGRNSLVVDHCHKTNKVRGLLCHPCNNMLGMAKDNPDTMRKGAAYVESHLDRS